MVARSVCLLALGIVLLAGCGGGGASDLTGGGSDEGITRQIGGGWNSRIHQRGLKPFQIAVDITPNGTATVAYTGIECGGEWNLDGVDITTSPPTYGFTETINTGAGGSCKSTGTVTLLPIQANKPNEPAYNRMNYRFTGGGVISRGVLHRAHTDGMTPIFKEAGVPLPVKEAGVPLP